MTVGHDAAITVAGQSGNFELNVMLPLIGSDLPRAELEKLLDPREMTRGGSAGGPGGG